ncbi:MAG: hypothetical protein H6739_29690 [Alphaproteobacteria bacterium]|nr:hypothetical protein [Alphaproteobacteria bacterium]
MQVRCPECGSSFTPPSTDGALTCPACFHEFTVQTSTASPWMQVEVRSATGRSLGTMDRHLVRQRIYEGQLKGHEEVRPTGGEWVPIAQRPEYAEVLRAVGVDLGADRIAQQALKGWRKTGSAIQVKKRKEAGSMVGKVASANIGAVVEEPEEPGDKPILGWVILGGIALVVAAIAAWRFLGV